MEPQFLGVYALKYDGSLKYIKGNEVMLRGGVEFIIDDPTIIDMWIFPKEPPNEWLKWIANTMFEMVTHSPAPEVTQKEIIKIAYEFNLPPDIPKTVIAKAKDNGLI